MLPEVGRIVPRGWRLLVALLAGAVWFAALTPLRDFPAQVRIAHLSQVSAEARNQDGFQRLAGLHHWAGITGRVVVVLLVLGVALALSAVAHGARNAPRTVQAVRVLTVLGVVLLFVTGVVVSTRTGSDCFRTCAPYPR